MIQMLGSSRLFDKVIQEDSNSTANNRIIDLYKVSVLAELENVPLLVKSSTLGTDATTYIDIYSDGVEVDSPVELYVFNNQSVGNTYNGWVIGGQLYCLLYNGSNFIAFPYSNNVSTSDTEAPHYYISKNVISLTSSSTVQEINEAFGDSSVVEEFINWIDNSSGPILIIDDVSTNSYMNTITNYNTSNDGLHYSIYFNTYNINNNNLELVYKVMTFNKTAATDTAFSSVSVQELTLTNGNGVAY